MVKLTKLSLAIIVAVSTNNSSATETETKIIGSAKQTGSEPIPVLTLSQSIGDLGAEILRTDNSKISIQEATAKAHKAALYLEIDGLTEKKEDAIRALEVAKSRGWVVFAESASWDVQQLHSFIETAIPETDLSMLQNSSIRIEWSESTAIVTDVWPSEAASETGITFANTSEGEAQLANKPLAKRGEGDSLAWFANAAYLANPGPVPQNLLQPGETANLAVNRDVVKVWKMLPPGQPANSPFNNLRCIVAWRGSSSPGDWERNLISQFTRADVINGAHPLVRAGQGYVVRWNNQSPFVDLDGCATVSVTGHSLGGGMAQLHAYMLTQYRRGGAPRLSRVSAYNPARVGNQAFVDASHQLISGDRRTIFCRTLDEVTQVPVGLNNTGTRAAYQCDVIAPFAFRPHRMGLWVP
jgi:hypothetical protein